MTKKLITIAVSIIMLFSIVAFTACDTTNADLLARIEALEQERQVIATLTQRIEALEAQNKLLQGIIDDLQSGATYNEAQIELLQEQIKALQDFVEELQIQIDELIESASYTNANLLALIQALQRQVDRLQEQIDKLEIQLLKAGREWGYSECGNFAVSLFIEETTLPRGWIFYADVKLINLSGKQVEIAYFNRPWNRHNTIFWSYIPNYTIELGEPQEHYAVNFLTIKRNRYYLEIMNIEAIHSIRTRPFFNGVLEYEISIFALFSINLGTENQEDFKIWSNTKNMTFF